VLGGFTAIGRRPADLPGDVSDLYWDIKAEVEKQLPHASNGRRFFVLSLAYTKYSQDKKIKCEYYKGTKTQQDLRTIHNDMRLAASPDYIPDIVEKANDILIGALKEGGTAFALDSIKSMKPSVWHDVKAHLTTLLVVGIAISVYEPVGHWLIQLIHGHFDWSAVRNIGEWIAAFAKAQGG
jgi:hypothetical protein